MLEWWRERRREKLLEAPFPPAYSAILARNVRHYSRLDPAAQKCLRDLVQVFIAEKRWEGCGGLRLTDQMKVTIAAQACVLILELPHGLYRNVQSILVYPSSFMRPAQTAGAFITPQGVLASGPIALVGEALAGGPVILAWDCVRHDRTDHYAGHNLVYHEFAHKLDMLDGQTDGTPPLASRAERDRWRAVCERVFLDLRARSKRSEPTFIDAYGATDEAEFFAVVTEHFFDQPLELQQAEPELYDVFKAFYRQDPAALERRSEGRVIGDA